MLQRSHAADSVGGKSGCLAGRTVARRMLRLGGTPGFYVAQTARWPMYFKGQRRSCPVCGNAWQDSIKSQEASFSSAGFALRGRELDCAWWLEHG